MQLCDICPAPCFPGAGSSNIPEPGASSSQFRFARDRDRDFYAVLLNNHPPTRCMHVNPRVAILGLSPAGTQMSKFARAFRQHRDYGRASVEAAFSGGLDGDIIRMMHGLGLTPKLGVSFPRMSLAEHRDIWVTSVVACATLKDGCDSATWDPLQYEAAKRCISKRLVPELLNPAWTRLKAVLVLGNHGWNTLTKLVMPDGGSALDSLQRAGKLVLRMPHPSGSNGELVALAKKTAAEFPSKEAFLARKLAEYRGKPAADRKQSEAEYLGRRETVWTNVSDLRRQIERMAPANAV